MRAGKRPILIDMPGEHERLGAVGISLALREKACGLIGWSLTSRQMPGSSE
jgi:hypothetical protein